MSVVRKSTPPTSSPMALTARTAISAIVRVDDVGHVERGTAGREVAGGAEEHLSPDDRHRVGACTPWRASIRPAWWSNSRRVSTFSWPMPRRGSRVDLVDELDDRVHTVTHDVPGHPLRYRDELAVDHQHPVIEAADERSRR